MTFGYDDTRIKTDESLMEILQRRGKYSHDGLRKEVDSLLRYGDRLGHKWYDRKGFVYVVYFGWENIYKIGLAKNVERRMGLIGTVEAPMPMKLEHVIATDDMFVVESSLHQYFADDRMGGEWFRLSPAELAMIKSIQAINIHDKIANDDPYTLIEDEKPEVKMPGPMPRLKDVA